MTVSLLGDIFCASDYYKEPHSHEDVEICVVTRGHGSFESGGASLAVGSGDIFLAPPGIEHASAADPADPYRMYYLAFSLATRHRLYRLFEELKNVSPRAFRDSFDIAHLLGLMVYELQEQEAEEVPVGAAGLCRRESLREKKLQRNVPSPAPAALEPLLELVIGYLHREAVSGRGPGAGRGTEDRYPAHRGGGRQLLVDRMVRFIDANLHLRLSLELLSEELGYSAGYLSRVFKEHTGRPLSGYWNRTKLDAARRYLFENPGVTVAGAAEAYGFDDQHYFSRLYKRHFGLPPKVDRSQNGSERL